MIDIMAFGAHPDDVEIFMGGSLLKFQDQGYQTAVCDLSRGESGTHGSAKLRAREAEQAAAILGLAVRETLDMPDSNIQCTRENKIKIIKIIRQYQPEIICSFWGSTRHPDHNNTGCLVREAAYLAGLKKIQWPEIKERRAA